MANLETIKAGTDTIYSALGDPEAKALVSAALEHCDDERSAADLAVEFGLDDAIGRAAAIEAIHAVQGRE